MIFDWFRRGKQVAPRLKAIYIAEAAGAAMKAVTTVEAVSNLGLKGDRYCNDSGHWKSIEACQVTLISEHDLRRAKSGTNETLKIALDDGAHRRNLLIEGIKTSALDDRTFRIGKVVFKHEKVRPPCGYIDQIAGQGMCKALGRNSGICIKVIEAGVMTIGDEVEIIQ